MKWTQPLKIKSEHAQIHMPKFGIPTLKTACINPCKELKHSLEKWLTTLLLFFPFPSSTITKLEIETYVSEVLDNFYPFFASFW